MTKIVINTCFGGFGLSEAAYAKLIEWGVPVRKYIEQPRDPITGLYQRVPENEGRIIFDHALSPETAVSAGMMRLRGRYWETWSKDARDDAMIVRVVEEFGTAANGKCAKLKIVEIPDGIEWEIEEYDGNEHVSEKHQTWR